MTTLYTLQNSHSHNYVRADLHPPPNTFSRSLANNTWYHMQHTVEYILIHICTCPLECGCMRLYIVHHVHVHYHRQFIRAFISAFFHAFIHSFIVLRFCVYLFDPVFIHWFMWFLPQFLTHPLPMWCYCKAWRRIFHVHCFYILYIFSFIVCYLIMDAHMIRITHTYVFKNTLLVRHCLHILFNV